MDCQILLRIVCEDRPGIIAAASNFIHLFGGNIVDLNHHSDEEARAFFLRMRISLPAGQREAALAIDRDARFNELAQRFGWSFTVHDAARRPRIAVLVSKTDHCLYELILKSRDGFLNAEIACVISNHPDLQAVATRFELPFRHLPVIDGAKERQEDALDGILHEHGVEAVVLARYMQILTPGFVRRWPYRIINVHHGFLPAFAGARPYHRAWERGVKIIGATAHYATEDLDEGPIIFQDVIPVPQNPSVQELIESGRDVERKVLVNGVKLHLEHRVFRHQHRTIIL